MVWYFFLLVFNNNKKNALSFFIHLIHIANKWIYFQKLVRSVKFADEVRINKKKQPISTNYCWNSVIITVCRSLKWVFISVCLFYVFFLLFDIVMHCMWWVLQKMLMHIFSAVFLYLHFNAQYMVFIFILACFVASEHIK